MSSKKRKPAADQAAPTPPTMPDRIPFPPATAQKLQQLINLRDEARATEQQAIARINDILEAIGEVIPPGYILKDIATGYIREEPPAVEETPAGDDAAAAAYHALTGTWDDAIAEAEAAEAIAIP